MIWKGTVSIIIIIIIDSQQTVLPLCVVTVHEMEIDRRYTAGCGRGGTAATYVVAASPPPRTCSNYNLCGGIDNS